MNQRLRATLASGVTLVLLSMTPAGSEAAPAPRARLVVRTWPLKARVEIKTDEGKVLRGRAPFRARLRPQMLTVTITKRKHRRLQRAVTLPAGGLTLNLCIDPDDQLMRCRLLIDGVSLRPKAVAFSRDSAEVWVAQLIKTRRTASIRIYDTNSGLQKASIMLGHKGATELEFSRDGEKVYASQMATGRVYEIDRRSRKVLRAFETRGTWTKVITISADEQTLFASNWVSGDVSVIDLRSGRLKMKLRAGKWPRGMYATPDGRYLYVAIFGEGRLVKFDLKTKRRRVLYNRGTSIRHIVADEARKLLFISDLGGNRIMKLDLRNDKVTFFARTGYRPNTIALSPDKRLLFVSCRGRGNKESYLKAGPEWGVVLIYDTRSARLLDAIVAGNQPTGLDVSADGKLLVFSDFLDDRLRIYRVPESATLLGGRGGRARTYQRDLPK